MLSYPTGIVYVVLHLVHNIKINHTDLDIPEYHPDTYLRYTSHSL